MNTELQEELVQGERKAQKLCQQVRDLFMTLYASQFKAPAGFVKQMMDECGALHDLALKALIQKPLDPGERRQVRKLRREIDDLSDLLIEFQQIAFLTDDEKTLLTYSFGFLQESINRIRKALKK